MTVLPEWQPQAHMDLFRINDCSERDFIREEGRFEVRYNDKVKTFARIIGAYGFYLSIQTEATLYDVTDGEELLEMKRYLRQS